MVRFFINDRAIAADGRTPPIRDNNCSNTTNSTFAFKRRLNLALRTFVDEVSVEVIVHFTFPFLFLETSIVPCKFCK